MIYLKRDSILHSQNRVRYVLSLLPTAFVILGRSWLPELSIQTPGAFHYPVVFLATLIGNFYTGLISTIACTAYNLFVIRPHLLHDLYSDPSGLTRIVMFFSTSILFLTLIALLERSLKKERHAAAVRNDFISMVSHELRTPLTSIKLNVEVLKNSLPEMPEKLSKVLASLDRQSCRQERLINSMIDLALIDSGQLSISKQKWDLKDVIESACESAKNVLQSGDFEYHLQSLVVEIDRHKMNEAIYNIVQGLIKYNNEQPLEVSLAEQAGHGVIEIRNRDIVISKENQKIIFERFANINNEALIHDLGIGFYLARHFVELHEGKIELESSKELGSVFRIILPLE